jgi:hypothetical protein
MKQVLPDGVDHV